MATQRRAQTSIYETTVENKELEEALKARESVKERLSTARQNFKVSDERAKKLIEALDFGDDTPIRVGDFIVTRKRTKEAPVEFTRSAGTRVYIKPIK